MYYRYQPYPYYRRYYNIDPYYYGRYYNPFYNYQQNVIDSQIANTDQSIINYGDMTGVIQDSNIWQSRVGMCTTPMSSVGVGTTYREPSEDEMIDIPFVGVGTTGDPIIIPGPGPITEPLVSNPDVSTIVPI